MSNQQQDRPFSLRRSLVVWVSGAVLGWVVAVVAVYGVIRNQGNSVAESDVGAPGQEKSLAIENPADHLNPDELRAIVETAPAAGDPGAARDGAGDGAGDGAKLGAGDEDRTGEADDEDKPEDKLPDAKQDDAKQDDGKQDGGNPKN